MLPTELISSWENNFRNIMVQVIKWYKRDERNKSNEMKSTG